MSGDENASGVEYVILEELADHPGTWEETGVVRESSPEGALRAHLVEREPQQGRFMAIPVGRWRPMTVRQRQAVVTEIER